MWPLLLCSIVSVAIVIERALFWLRLRRRRDRDAVEDVLHRTEEGDFESAVERGREVRDCVAGVLAAGLAHRDHGLTESMQVAAEDEMARVRRGLGVLDTIITLAPLLGILGTVLGIIESFDMLGQAGLEDPRAVTGGIAQALITTAAGLSVAIVTLIPYNYLIHAVDGLASEVETLGTSLEVAYRKGLEKRDEAA
jgi:biopolymer transport protein ExbB